MSVSAPQVPSDIAPALTFQQLANFVAIDKTGDFDGVLRRLLQQVLAVLPDEMLTTASELSDAAHTLFGLRLRLPDVEHSLRGLVETGSVIRHPNGKLTLPSSRQAEIEERVRTAGQLKDEVKAGWLNEETVVASGLDRDALWAALQQYFGRAFRLHGMSAVAALLPTGEDEGPEPERLGALLEESVAAHFAQADRPKARDLVTNFAEAVRTDTSRVAYIAELADSAFNLYALMVSPEVSRHLREKLSPLTLFLDTNFLFGVLGLQAFHAEASDELLLAIRKAGLPFTLRYHEATERELSNTLQFYRELLGKHRWPQHISRAAVASKAVSNIELAYHRRNAVTPLEVEDYFAPYDFWDTLLRDKNVDVYRAKPSQDVLRERAEMEGDYAEFLAANGRTKADAAIQHDMALLHAARSLRSRARSTLEAGALLLTWDSALCLYDWRTSRRLGIRRCAVPPSILWQVIRPFVSDGSDFDTAFAEAFALPEFAMNRGEAAKAASRLLSILAGLRNVAEQTAVRMLTNNLLISRLQQKRTEEEVAEAVESAIADENAALIEEKAALARENDAKAEALRTREAEVEEARLALLRREKALEENTTKLTERDGEILRLHQRQGQIEEQVRLQAQADADRHDREISDLRRQVDRQKFDGDKRYEKAMKAVWILAGLLLVGSMEVTLNLLPALSWVTMHPRWIGIQICLSLILFSGTVAIGVKEWRKGAALLSIISIVSGALLVLAQIIDLPGR